jgi:nitroimidazol reductase NimA-like FMN-containing flavoprotein (pyridoxamine 5'-phosphate oxidase superfamily)
LSVALRSLYRIMLSVNEVDLLVSERIARMATINKADRSPHVVPVCFVFDGKNIYTTLRARSKRLKNIEAGSKTSLLIDKYVEEGGEWKILCGLLIHGDVKILAYNEDKDEFMYGWKLLLQKYPQYKHWANPDLTPKDADVRRILKICPSKITGWGFG